MTIWTQLVAGRQMGCSGTKEEDFLVDRVKECGKKSQPRSTKEIPGWRVDHTVG